MNGTLAQLYNLAGLPASEIKKPAVMADAIKKIALILVYIYTEQHNTSQQITEILKMVSAISNRTHEIRKSDLPKNNFDKMTTWLTDRVLPYFVIGLIYLIIQIIVEYSVKK